MRDGNPAGWIGACIPPEGINLWGPTKDATGKTDGFKWINVEGDGNGDGTRDNHDAKGEGNDPRVDVIEYVYRDGKVIIKHWDLPESEYEKCLKPDGSIDWEKLKDLLKKTKPDKSKTIDPVDSAGGIYDEGESTYDEIDALTACEDCNSTFFVDQPVFESDDPALIWFDIVGAPSLSTIGGIALALALGAALLLLGRRRGLVRR